MQEMKMSSEGLNLLKKFEGCELKGYRCSAGVLTIGYGHTKGVTEGMQIDQPWCWKSEKLHITYSPEQ